jgi:hypothetical protein
MSKKEPRAACRIQPFDQIRQQPELAQVHT